MASPYRTAPSTSGSRGHRDSGIVGEIVGQFADKLAFYRELVQNAIDADTESIEVEARYESARQALLVSVTDFGSGMPQEVIENQLLVLFRSTKEGDDKRFGKFGIGFVSVLAVEPSLVSVVSCCQGTRHTLHLYPDLSYELFESGRCTKSSTRVELEIPMPESEVESFVSASAQALRRWCRHATPRITFLGLGASGEQLISERIDTELALPNALVSVVLRSGDGRMSAHVGIAPEQYSAFFNHGLLLYETWEPLLGGLSFVIQDSKLGHTLSRDSVRHDQHYEGAMKSLEEAIPLLRVEIVRRLNTLLDEGKHRLFRQLMSVASSSMKVDCDDWPVLLLHPVAGQDRSTVARFESGELFAARDSSAVTKGLAEAAIPVADLSAMAGEEEESWFFNRCPKLRTPELELTYVRPEECSGADLLLVEALGVLLDVVTREPSEIILAKLQGSGGQRLSVAGNRTDGLYKSESDTSWLLSESQADSDPFRLFARPALVVNVGNKEVAAARELAVLDPLAAANLLARHLLLEHEKSSRSNSEKLLNFALSELVGSKA